MVWMLLLLGACGPRDEPAGPDCDLSGPHLVLATTDYEVGALTAVDPATGCVADRLATIGADAVVRAHPDEVWVVQRTGGDAIRRYAPGAYAAPVTEFALRRGGNAHDLARVDDRIVVSMYEEAELVVADRQGTELGTIDLSAHADRDGLPEADRLVWADDQLWVGLQSLDRTAGWRPLGDGLVVPLDLDTLQTGPAVEVGSNPKIGPHPDDDSRLAVLTGLFFEPDGAVQAVSADGPDTLPLFTEAELGYDVTHLVGTGRHAVLLGVDFEVGGPARLDCVDLRSGEIVRGLDDAAWLVDAVADDTGTVWVASRTGWSGSGEAAVYRVEPETCEVEPVATGFALEPFSIAWVP